MSDQAKSVTRPGSFNEGRTKYVWILLLCATSPETLVLMPWAHREDGDPAILTAGGLPNMHVAVFCTVAAAFGPRTFRSW